MRPSRETDLLGKRNPSRKLATATPVRGFLFTDFTYNHIISISPLARPTIVKPVAFLRIGLMMCPVRRAVDKGSRSRAIPMLNSTNNESITRKLDPSKNKSVPIPCELPKNLQNKRSTTHLTTDTRIHSPSPTQPMTKHNQRKPRRRLRILQPPMLGALPPLLPIILFLSRRFLPRQRRIPPRRQLCKNRWQEQRNPQNPYTCEFPVSVCGGQARTTEPEFPRRFGISRRALFSFFGRRRGRVVDCHEHGFEVEDVAAVTGDV